MEWLILAKYTLMLILKNTLPAMIVKAMMVDIWEFRHPKQTLLVSILLAVGTIVPFASYVQKWWYVPSWMIALLTAVYVADLMMAIALTGKLKKQGWEFRSDKFKVWVANYIGALMVLGLLHFLPLASKAILSGLEITGLKAEAAYYSLLTTAWGAYIGICLSNTASALSNAARAGILTKELSRWIIKRFDTYKPSVFEEEDGVGQKQSDNDQ